MPDNPNAEIIAIGTELLLGEITDTNSVFLARKLRDIGVNVFFMTTVGDNLGRIKDAISDALDRAEIVITTGGLGPTVDDMTRQAVAEALGRPLQFHQSLYDIIAERFRGFGSKMTENNRQQAYLPAGAHLIKNPVGTAPSFIVESDRGVVISVPGVPREMKYLIKESAIPYLLRKYQLGVIVARILRTAGIGESSLDDQIGSEILSETNPSVGLAAHHGSVDIRVTAKAESKADAKHLLDQMQARLEARIGEHVFGIDDAALEEVVWRHIQRRQLRIHVTEAGLPGVVSGSWEGGTELLTTTTYDQPQHAFEHFAVGAAAVSLRELAMEIAERVRSNRGVDASLAVLSYPNLEENPDFEQGSAVAIATALDQRYRVYGFGARSPLAREWLSRWALANLWKMLRELPGD